MRTLEYRFDIADVPDDITPQVLADHKRRVLAHVETTIDAHHKDVLDREDERRKKKKTDQAP
jgi:hypothetical protein